MMDFFFRKYISDFILRSVIWTWFRVYSEISMSGSFEIFAVLQNLDDEREKVKLLAAKWNFNICALIYIYIYIYMCVCVCVCVCVCMCVCVISKLKSATVVEGDPKAPFSIATTPRCSGGNYSFPWIAPLCRWSVLYNAEC